MIPLGKPAAPGSKKTLLIEFDGKIKYTDEKMLAGREKSEVFTAQYAREERLREMGFDLIRISWSDLISQENLKYKLSRFDIPKLIRR